MPPIESIPKASYQRAVTTVLPPTSETPSFTIDRKTKSYKHQYSNIYFVRLRLLRNFVEDAARKRWKNLEGNPIMVPRVLEVVKSRLCYIIGTVYMDMPLKPNVMEEIARDRSLPALPPTKKIYSSEDNIMLEDESGRIRLVGDRIRDAKLVTGVIIGALGAETANGDFEVADICYPGMSPMGASEGAEDLEDAMAVDDEVPRSEEDPWIGVISGLNVGSISPSDAQIQMLVEYLTGEAGSTSDQESMARVSRLIIAGNSLSLPQPSVNTNGVENAQTRKQQRYGYEASTFTPHPIKDLSDILLDIGTAIPINILPGDTDPSGIIMPQQPFPRHMFGQVSKLPSFSCETNPTYMRLGCSASNSQAPIARSLLINSGQPLNDMFKYLPSPPHTRLSVLESTLNWRHLAPTAPDTLWCHPYFDGDPFIIPETPDIYIVGGQKKFATKLVPVRTGEGKNLEDTGRHCRIVMVPEFSSSGLLAMVNARTLEVKTVKFAVEGMTTGGEEVVPVENQQQMEVSESMEPVSSEPQHSLSSQFV